MWICDAALNGKCQYKLNCNHEKYHKTYIKGLCDYYRCDHAKTAGNIRGCVSMTADIDDLFDDIIGDLEKEEVKRKKRVTKREKIKGEIKERIKDVWRSDDIWTT